MNCWPCLLEFSTWSLCFNVKMGWFRMNFLHHKGSSKYSLQRWMSLCWNNAVKARIRRKKALLKSDITFQHCPNINMNLSSPSSCLQPACSLSQCITVIIFKCAKLKQQHSQMQYGHAGKHNTYLANINRVIERRQNRWRMRVREWPDAHASQYKRTRSPTLIFCVVCVCAWVCGNTVT